MILSQFPWILEHSLQAEGLSLELQRCSLQLAQPSVQLSPCRGWDVLGVHRPSQRNSAFLPSSRVIISDFSPQKIKTEHQIMFQPLWSCSAGYWQSAIELTTLGSMEYRPIQLPRGMQPAVEVTNGLCPYLRCEVTGEDELSDWGPGHLSTICIAKSISNPPLPCW